jgi:hypothetical protein
MLILPVSENAWNLVQSLTDTELTEVEWQRAYDENEEIASEGDGCVSKDNSDKATRADVSKFGSC